MHQQSPNVVQATIVEPSWPLFAGKEVLPPEEQRLHHARVALRRYFQNMLSRAENQRQRSPGGCQTKVEEACATQGPLAFDISVCVSRAATKQTVSHHLEEFWTKINKAFICMH